MIKTDRRVLKSKQALKSAFIQLMNEKELQQITITDLVDFANINRGTFYKHYQTKTELFHELVEDILSDLVHSYRSPYLNKKTFTPLEMKAPTILIFNHIKRFSDFYQTILLNEHILPGFQNKLCSIIKDLSLNDLQTVQKTNSINQDLQASYQAHALVGLIIEWVKSDFKYSMNYMSEQLIKILSTVPITMKYHTSKNSNDKFK